MTMTISADVMISMLRKGNTGNEILQILDVITSTETEEVIEEIVAEDAKAKKASKSKKAKKDEVVDEEAVKKPTGKNPTTLLADLIRWS